MIALKSFAFVVGVSALYFALIFLGYAFGGAGHGSVFFAAALLSPFSTSGGVAGLSPLGLAIWPTVGLLLALRRFRSCKIAAAAILVLHYLGIVVLSLQTEWSSVSRIWHSMWEIVALVVAAYLGSQAYMWVLITRRENAG